MEDDAEVAEHREVVGDILKMREELRQAIRNVVVADSILEESLRKATETGYELGLVAGIIASVEHLESKGFYRNAAELRKLIANNPLAQPYAGEA
jgi:hypothetical protein